MEILQEHQTASESLLYEACTRSCCDAEYQILCAMPGQETPDLLGGNIWWQYAGIGTAPEQFQPRCWTQESQGIQNEQ